MNGYLKPRTLQLFGIGLFMVAVAFWALTDRESTLIMGSAMTLIGIGAYSKTIDRMSSVLEKKVDSNNQKSAQAAE